MSEWSLAPDQPLKNCSVHIASWALLVGFTPGPYSWALLLCFTPVLYSWALLLGLTQGLTGPYSWALVLGLTPGPYSWALTTVPYSWALLLGAHRRRFSPKIDKNPKTLRNFNMNGAKNHGKSEKLLSFFFRAGPSMTGMTASMTVAWQLAWQLKERAWQAIFLKKSRFFSLFFKKIACHARSLSCQASCQATVMLAVMPVMLGPARKKKLSNFSDFPWFFAPFILKFLNVSWFWSIFGENWLQKAVCKGQGREKTVSPAEKISCL